MTQLTACYLEQDAAAAYVQCVLHIADSYKGIYWVG
jgi:hypothetical protein